MHVALSGCKPIWYACRASLALSVRNETQEPTAQTILFLKSFPAKVWWPKISLDVWKLSFLWQTFQRAKVDTRELAFCRSFAKPSSNHDTCLKTMILFHTVLHGQRPTGHWHLCPWSKAVQQAATVWQFMSVWLVICSVLRTVCDWQSNSWPNTNAKQNKTIEQQNELLIDS